MMKIHLRALLGLRITAPGKTTGSSGRLQNAHDLRPAADAHGILELSHNLLVGDKCLFLLGIIGQVPQVNQQRERACVLQRQERLQAHQGAAVRKRLRRCSIPARPGGSIPCGREGVRMPCGPPLCSYRFSSLSIAQRSMWPRTPASTRRPPAARTGTTISSYWRRTTPATPT